MSVASRDIDMAPLSYSSDNMRIVVLIADFARLLIEILRAVRAAGLSKAELHFFLRHFDLLVRILPQETLIIIDTLQAFEEPNGNDW